MLNFINKILNYFGYKILGVGQIEEYELRIEYRVKLLEEEKIENYSLKREKDRLINLVAEKDKDILALEHKVENFKGIIEQDKITRLDIDIFDLSNQVDIYKQLASKRYKELNTLRSRVKGLIDSRDNYKRKYREICGKIALNNAVKK